MKIRNVKPDFHILFRRTLTGSGDIMVFDKWRHYFIKSLLTSLCQREGQEGIKVALYILRKQRSELVHYGCLGVPLGLWPFYTVATSSAMALRMVSSKRKRTADI